MIPPDSSNIAHWSAVLEPKEWPDGVVEAGIYRSGQPGFTDWKWIKPLVTKVIKLNLESEGTDEAATYHNLDLVYLPIDKAQQIITGPDKDHIVDAVMQMELGTLVHCQHGEDRCGLVCALYRVWQEGWSKERAEKEMLEMGFHRTLLGLWGFWLEHWDDYGGDAS